MSLSCDKIICIGKNYLDHARELGDAVPEKPVLFLKPASACVELPPDEAGEDPPEVALPHGRGEIHHEAEIVARLDAHGRITAVTLGLDLTLRELQARLKKAGHPWEISKAFPNSAIVGPWIPAAEFPDFLDLPFTLAIDGKVVQSGTGSQMRLKPAECAAYAAEHFALRDGDLLFTGTPAGVGPVRAGQTATLEWGTRLRYSLRFA